MGAQDVEWKAEIDRSITVSPNRTLFINNNSNRDFENLSPGSTTSNSYLDGYICNDAVVDIEASAKMQVGSNFTNSASLTVTSGSKVNLKSGSELKILTGSKMIIEDGAELNTIGASLLIEPGAELIVSPSALYTMNGGTLKIENGGKLSVGVDAIMEYSGGGTYLNGPNAVFELGGIVKVMGGNKLHLGHENDNLDAGYLHIKNSGYPEWHFEAIGVNNEIELEGTGQDNLILKIDVGAEFSSSGLSAFRKIKIRHGKVEMFYDSRINLLAEDSYLYNVYFDSESGSRGVHVYRKNLFQSCKFSRGGIWAYLDYWNENLRVSNSEFGTSTLEVRGGAFGVSSCDFDGTYITMKALSMPSIFLNNDFINCGFNSVLNGSTINLTKNTFLGGENYPPNTTFSEIYNQGGKVDLRCNTFKDIKLEVSETYLSMRSSFSNGYNNFSGAQGEYITWDKNSSTIYLTNGYNNFESSEPNAQFILKVPNGFDETVVMKMYNNRWEKYDQNFQSYFDEGPVQERFDFKIDPPSITPSENGIFNLIDPYANVTVKCGDFDPKKDLIGSGNIISPKDVSYIDDSFTIGTSENKNIFDDPILNTDLLDSIALSQAVFYAIDTMQFNNDSLGNDFVALDIFYDVLTYEFDSLSIEAEEMLDLAFQNMKTTVEHAFLTDTILHDDNVTNFHPMVQKYVDVLMIRSDSMITDENYNEQFYLEIDKAQMFNLIGNKNMCWQLLSNLDNCPVDSTEQDYLNKWLATIGQQILYQQAGFENYNNDSIVGQVDTTLFNTPSPIEANEFYFGSQIIAVDQVTYANCGLITFKKIDHESDRNFMIYPNPTSGILTIAFEQDDAHDLVFKIHDANGRNVLVRNISGKKGLMQLDINYLPQSTYFYTIEDDNGLIESGQVVKQ